MYRKVMVMEVKEHYALAMGEDGQIVRIRYKAGMQIGDCIYILEEDLYQEEKTERQEPPVSVHLHPFWKQLTAVAAAAVLFVVLFTWSMKPGTAYAMVTVDGVKNVELTLDKKHVVKDALSRDGSFTEQEMETLVGQKVDAAQNYADAEKEGTAIIGYALCRTMSEEEEKALQRSLEQVFGTDGVLYICGSKEDAEKAKKAGKSLGIYLAEQAVSEDDLDRIQSDLSEKEIWELLKKQPMLMEDEEAKEKIENAWSRYQEDVLEDDDDTEESDREEEQEIEDDELEKEVPESKEEEESEIPNQTEPEAKEPDIEEEEPEDSEDRDEPEQQEAEEAEDSETED